MILSLSAGGVLALQSYARSTQSPPGKEQQISMSVCLSVRLAALAVDPPANAAASTTPASGQDPPDQAQVLEMRRLHGISEIARNLGDYTESP